MITKGTKVKVIKLMSDTADEYDQLVYEHTSCFLGKIGVVETEPVWLESEPEKGPLGQVVATDVNAVVTNGFLGIRVKNHEYAPSASLLIGMFLKKRLNKLINSELSEGYYA